MSLADGKLVCDGWCEGRPSTVTHIDHKGYIYCAACGVQRQETHRCRRMAAWELKMLREGRPLQSYEPITKAASESREFRHRAHSSGHAIQHIDGNPRNNELSNLRVVTLPENAGASQC